MTAMKKSVRMWGVFGKYAAHHPMVFGNKLDAAEYAESWDKKVRPVTVSWTEGKSQKP